MNNKPLAGNAYGSIPHLPGSRRGPADAGLSEQQAAILTHRARDARDAIIVQEKLDGSCMAIARLDSGKIVSLVRRGYLANSSPFPQHHAFDRWVSEHHSIFVDLLSPGERLCGEWLYEAHGTRYALPHVPFVAFDIMTGYERTLSDVVRRRCLGAGIPTPRLLSIGQPIAIEAVLARLEPSGHGALDSVEGAVWRVERNGKVDFLGKYVRPEKIDGCYLESVTGKPSMLNTWKRWNLPVVAARTLEEDKRAPPETPKLRVEDDERTL